MERASSVQPPLHPSLDPSKAAKPSLAVGTQLVGVSLVVEPTGDGIVSRARVLRGVEGFVVV